MIRPTNTIAGDFSLRHGCPIAVHLPYGTPKALLWICLVVFCVMTAAPCLLANTDQIAQTGSATINREYKIKGAFLYHFLSYIDWPNEAFNAPDSPLVIGIFGEDPFGPILDKIADSKQIEGRSIQIIRAADAQTLLGSHIVFVPGTTKSEEEVALLKAVEGSYTLSVGETARFIENGGSVQFFLEGNKVRFQFNMPIVDNSSLRISSKLLDLAKRSSRQ